MPQIDLIVIPATLPEGWEGTPDQLLEFYAANSTYQIDGDFPAGQIGGSRPTQDIGVWYNATSIETFRDGKYQPITDVPPGSIVIWPGANSSAPENYLFCEGQSLTRTDYPELFAVIGTTYGSESATTFTLPDFRGRFPSGSGVGDMKYQSITGKIPERAVGAYFGYVWPTLETTALYTGAPTKSMTYVSILPLISGTTTRPKYASSLPPSIAMRFIIRTR